MAMKHSWILLLILLLNTCTTPSIIATREQQKGDYHFNQYRYNEALQHYENFLQASEKLGLYRNLRMEAEVLRKIAHCHITQGQFINAQQNLRLAIVSDSLDRNLLGLIESYKDLGRAFLSAGNYKTGIQNLEYALKLSDENEESVKDIRRTSVANIYLSLAQAYLSLGRFGDALSITNKAHSLFIQTGYSNGIIETYLLMGIIQTDLGNLNEAIAFIDKSEEMAAREGINAVRQNLVQAEIAGMSGDFNEALKKTDHALQEANRVQIIPQMIWTYIRAGDLYSILGDSKNSRQFYNNAYLLFEKEKESKSLTVSLGLRYNELEGIRDYLQQEELSTESGLLYLKMANNAFDNNDYSTAFNFFLKADSSFSKSGNREGIAQSKLGMAKVFNEGQKPDNAVINLNQVISLTKNREIRWQTYYEKGISMELSKNYDSAKVSYEKAIDIIESSRGSITPDDLKSLYLNNKIKVYDRLIQLLIRENKIEESLLISEKARARAFLDLLGNKEPPSVVAKENELISQEQGLNLKLTHLQKQLYDLTFSQYDFSRSVEIERSITEELSKAQDEYDLLIRRIKITHPDYYNVISVEPPDLKNVQAVIPAKTAVLIYWMSENELFLWIVNPVRIELVRIDTNIEELRQTAVELNRLLQNNLTEKSIPLLERLNNILIQPAEKYLDNISTLCIIPHAILHLLPFHALRTSEKSYLGEKYYISYMPSSAILAELKKKTCLSDRSFMGMALGDKMIGTFSGLPGTSYELKIISEQFSRPLAVFEDESTEGFVKQNSSGKEIIHIATHGYFNGLRPRYSFLLFAPDERNDGQLNVNEIMNLDLNACIVTLSACETGLGEISKGDELTGLSRAFMGAGANTVAVSLWSVADRPTAELMISFYKYLRTELPYIAMTKAQRETMKKYPQPFYWAPFVVIGGKL